MKSETTYRVVGVRENGERVIISKNASRPVAERVVKLIERGNDFMELLIEPDEGDPPRKQ